MNWPARAGLLLVACLLLPDLLNSLGVSAGGGSEKGAAKRREAAEMAGGSYVNADYGVSSAGRVHISFCSS